VLEPEFDEAERHLPAFRRVGHNLCQYVLISVSGPHTKSRDLNYTETLLLLITHLQGKGNNHTFRKLPRDKCRLIFTAKKDRKYSVGIVYAQSGQYSTRAEVTKLLSFVFSKKERTCVWCGSILVMIVTKSLQLLWNYKNKSRWQIFRCTILKREIVRRMNIWCLLYLNHHGKPRCSVIRTLSR
jgi:hypothetical protein